MKNYLISIIIPIFNAETYLSETINSIIRQSIGFENIELILVDDKSTDNSKYVIDDYSSKYANIIPIFLDKNSGSPGFVRNKGLEIATAEYIMFIDSDDEYEIDMCEQLYNTLLENNCDCVVCAFNNIDYLTNVSNISNKNKKLILNPIDALYTCNLYVWNKIFKKNIIKKNNIRFPNCVGEDTFFCIEYFINSKLIVLLDEYYGYNYIDRGESFSTTNLKWNLNVISHLYGTLEIFYENNLEINLSRYFKGFIAHIIFSTIKMTDNDWSSIFKVLENLYLFEKEIKFDNKEIIPFLARFINKFIVTNHITIATLIILIFNRIYNAEFILKMYRKIHSNI